MMRRLVSVSVIVGVPLVLGLLVFVGALAGLYHDAAFGFTVFSVLALLVFAAVIWADALALDRRKGECRQVEEAFSESEARFRAFDAALPQQVWTARPDGSVDYVNQRVLDYSGRTFEQMTGWGWQQLLHPGDLPRWTERWAAALKTGESLEIEFRLKRAGDDVYRWHVGRASPARDREGRITQWFGTNTDITEYKQAAEEQKQKEERYRSLTVATSQIIWITAPDGKIVEDLPSWRAYTGQSKEEYEGWGWNNAVHPDDRERARKAWAHAVETRSFYEIEYRLRMADGGYGYVAARGVPVLAEDGSIREWVGTCTDITRRKEAEEALQKARNELETRIQERTGDMAKVLTEIGEVVNTLGSSAEEILASTTELAASATQTATAVTQTTTTVEQIRQTAQVASQKARHVADSAQDAARTSQAGRRATEQTTAGMGRVREQMASIAESMGRLSEHGQAIGQIIATVDDLAQQSNLLAVNASIEAAKAGEQGKGFAVVAQEVKSLAEQSRQATTQVRAILGDIQRATGAAVMATEQGGKAVEAGLAQSVEAGQSIQALAEGVSAAAQAAAQIAASSQQQLAGMDQMVLAMESIKQASGQNVDGARQLEASARGLADLGQKLKEQADRYQV